MVQVGINDESDMRDESLDAGYECLLCGRQL